MCNYNSTWMLQQIGHEMYVFTNHEHSICRSKDTGTQNGNSKERGE